MSNHQFTDKQINNFIKRNKGKKGWLNTRDARSENMSSIKTRELMKLVCDDPNVAFDNQISFQYERYQICFEIDNKDRMIEELEYFDNLVLSHPLMLDIPSKSLLHDKSTAFDLSNWNSLKIGWIEVYKAFCRYQNGQKIEDFQYFYLSTSFVSNNESLWKKDHKDSTLIKIRGFISMYKSFKIGWKEINHLFPLDTCNGLFVRIIRLQYDESFRRRTRAVETINSSEKQINHSRKSVELLNFSNNAKRELERLSKCEELNDFDKNFYKLTLEKYNQEAHGQGREEALAVLKKVAREDTQVMQLLMDFHQALSLFGKFTEESKHGIFDNFLECDGVGDLVSYDNQTSYCSSKIEQVLDSIKEVMRASDDPRVRAAVSEWVEAISKIHNFDVKISRRNEQDPEKRY